MKRQTYVTFSLRMDAASESIEAVRSRVEVALDVDLRGGEYAGAPHSLAWSLEFGSNLDVGEELTVRTFFSSFTADQIPRRSITCNGRKSKLTVPS